VKGEKEGGTEIRAPTADSGPEGGKRKREEGGRGVSAQSYRGPLSLKQPKQKRKKKRRDKKRVALDEKPSYVEPQPEVGASKEREKKKTNVGIPIEVKEKKRKKREDKGGSCPGKPALSEPYTQAYT